MKKHISSIAILLGLSSYAAGQDSTSKFIKLEDKTEHSGLQIAVTEYVSSNSKASVTLYGVIHVADEDYYKKVQTDLDKFDVVLYEGIKTGTQPNPETKILNNFQRLMGDVLDLKFQKDSIDYTRKNLVHADVTIDQLNDSLKGQSITPFGLKADQIEPFKPFMELSSNLVKEIFRASPDLQSQVKTMLAEQLTKTDISKQLPAEMYKGILLDRNKIVIETLEKQFELTHDPNLFSQPKKSYAIFYGAAHMEDLEKRLQVLGFKEKTKRWMTAWKFTPEKSEEEENK